MVPFPPGGPADILARTLGQHLSERWGQQVVIDNRAGAGGNIGSDSVAKAPPDGYTLLLGGRKVLTSTPQEFGAFIVSETEKWAKVVKFSGARVD